MAEEISQKKEADQSVAEKKPEDKVPEKSQSSVPQVASYGDIEIYCGEPLPHYNIGSNKAYKAHTQSQSGEALFAIVCEKNMIPRRKAASKYTSIINPSLAFLVSFGKTYWPPAKQERFVFIYKDNLGKPLLEKKAFTAMGWKQDKVMDLVVNPMVTVLQDFRDRDFFHGNIRPTNMYEGDGSLDPRRVILGDGLSTPPSLTQPSVFETIERSMADPISRGTGTQADDLYAFGVSLAVMMRSEDPLEGLSQEEIIEEKIRQGSYAAVTGKDRFKGSILELLRGLLHDDPTQRWTVDEILVWMDGRRLSPKQSVKRKKAARPLMFGGQKFLQVPLLVMALDKFPAEAVKMVEDGSLEQWLERSLEDDNAVEQMGVAVSKSGEGGRGAGYQDRLVANLAAVLDTMGPARFRGLRMLGDGIGNALCRAMIMKEDVKPFVDFFLQGVAMNWITISENPSMDVGSLIGKFDSCRGSLRQTKSGFGIERCLYTLSTEAPCLSPKLDDYFVASPEDMMMAFEDLCEKGQAPIFFLDRHSIAFLSVNDPKSIDSHLFDLNAPEDYKRVMANLKTLAIIQKRSKMPKFPHIAQAFLKSLPCVFKRFHDQKMLEKIQGEVESAAASGDLARMVAALDNRQVVEKDFRAFREAMIEYAQLKLEYANLEDKLRDEKTFGRTTGKEFAALVSGAIAMLTIAVTTFMFLTDK